MTKPITFPCPHGKKPHDAYYHGNQFAVCLMHGRLLYTDIPQELKSKKKFKSQLTRLIEEDEKSRARVKRKLGKLLANAFTKLQLGRP